MTRRAARHHFFTSNLIVDLELVAIFLVNIARLVIIIEYFGLRPDELFRSTVTCDAPLHLKRIFLKNDRHIVDRTVAGRTAYALSDMNTMVKIGVFGQIVHFFPLDRFVVAETRPDGLKIWTVCPDLAVAIHTGLRRRHACRRRRFDRLVTIAAINAVIADMVLMAELNRLLLFQIAPGQIRRASELRVRKERRSAQHYCHDHADLGNIICTLRKNLCHLISLTLPLTRKN